MPPSLSPAAAGFLLFRVAFEALHEKALTLERFAHRQSQLPKGNNCRRNGEIQARPCVAMWLCKPGSVSNNTSLRLRSTLRIIRPPGSSLIRSHPRNSVLSTYGGTVVAPL
jgi:hypothetical protein